MYPSIPFLIERFDFFNKLMFEGKLPDVPLKIGRGRRILGSMSYKKRKLPGREAEYHSPKITISAAFDLSERQLEDILIHEMIHLHEFTKNNGRIDKPHGYFFYSEMQRINRIYGRNVTVKENLQKTRTEHPEETSSTGKTSFEISIIGILKIKNQKTGKTETGLTRIMKTRLFELHDKWNKIKDIESIEWYYTMSDEVVSLPRVKTLKYYLMTEEQIENILNHVSTTHLERVP